MATLRTRVAVVGGGISGLALGFHLQRLGIDVQVFETHGRAGGNIRSERRSGTLCEWGPNGWLDNEPATTRLIEFLGLQPQVVQASSDASTRWIVRAGALRALPQRPAQFLTSDVLSLRGRARVLLEWAQPPRREDADESVFDFAARRIGREAAEVLVDAMVTGIYAGDSRTLSLECAFPRMREMERRCGGLFKAMIARRRELRASRDEPDATMTAGARGEGDRRGAAGGPIGPGGTLTSFVDGMETLVRALVQALGPRLHLDTPVDAIAPIGDPAPVGGARGASHLGEPRWRLTIPDGESVEATDVVIAGPAWKAAALLHPLDAELASAVVSIPSAPVAVVCLDFRAQDLQHVSRGFGFLVPACEKLPILGTLFDSWVFPGRARDGQVLLRTMIGGARDPGAVEETDAQLTQRALTTLHRLLNLHGDPEVLGVIRHPRGIPQYPVGHARTLARIDTALQRHIGLHLSGNSYRGIAMNACIKEAEAIATRLAQR